MELEPWPSTHDPDLDVPRRRPTAPAGPIDPYRRLVVNPLPAVLCFVGAIVLLCASLQWRSLAAFLLAAVLLGVSSLLAQVHCLDCGVTTWLLRSRRHACEPAMARWREGRPARWHFPGVRTQVFVWLHLLASLAVLLLVFLVSWGR